ncbi:MAG: hypothetical protein AAF554_03640 [Bacteroidota bacterium]
MKKLSSYNNIKMQILSEVIIGLGLLIPIFYHSKKMGIEMFLIGMAILLTFLAYVVYRAKKFVALYFDETSNKFYLRKIFDYQKFGYQQIDDLRVTNFFLKTRKVVVEKDSSKETFFLRNLKDDLFREYLNKKTTD